MSATNRAMLVLLVACGLISCAAPPTPVPATAVATWTPAATSTPRTTVQATLAPTPQPVPATSTSSATAVPTSAAPASVAKLRVPYTAISVAMLPTWVAFEEGLFRKYGLDVSIDYIATSPVLTAAMLSGEVQMAEAAEEVVITSGLQGSDLVIIASGGDRLLFSLYTRPEIKTIDDMKGKKIGVTRRGASTDFAARWLLTKSNLKPDQEVGIVASGGVPEILTAMQTGVIDGGILSPPTTTRARQAGFKELVDISTQELPFYQAPLIARKSWIKENPDIVRNFMKGYIEGIAVIKKNKLAAKAAIGKYTKTTEDNVLEESYQAFARILPQAPYPKLEAIKTGLDQVAFDNPKAKDADPSQFFDPRWVEELDKSGFISGLYQ